MVVFVITVAHSGSQLRSPVGAGVPKLSQNSRIVGNRGTVIVGAGFIPARLEGL